MDIKTLFLIGQIRKSNVLDIIPKEYNYTNVRNDIFKATGNSFSCKKKGKSMTNGTKKEPVLFQSEMCVSACI